MNTEPIRYRTELPVTDCIRKLTAQPWEYGEVLAPLWYRCDAVTDSSLLLTFRGGKYKKIKQTRYLVRFASDGSGTTVTLEFRGELLGAPPMTPIRDVDLLLEQRLLASRVQPEEAAAQSGYLCHRDYRTTVPVMRLFLTALTALAFPGLLPLLAVVLWWTLRQWHFARAAWSLEGDLLCNTLGDRTAVLDLSGECCVSAAAVQCIQVKDQQGYVQMQFYVFSRLPSGFRPGLTGYGGPGAIARMRKNGLFLLPVQENTTRWIRTRCPDSIPTFPEHIRIPAEKP